MQYVDLKHERDYYQEQSKTLATFIRTLGIIVTTIFSFGAMIGAMITMYAAVANRTVEVGTLRALGFRRRSVLGRSEEHTSELQSLAYLVCRLLLEKKKKK